MGDPVVTGMALCAGVGGLELGLQLAVPGYRCLAHIEREAYAAAIILARMEEQILEPAPIFAGDLADFDARPFAGLVDILSAGIPCQPYSVAGRGEGHADERALWPEFVRIVGECRPALVFIENVPKFASWFREPGERLCELGYEIADPLFLAAEDIGAPHKRERVFILAWRVSDPIGGVLWSEQGRSKSRGSRASESGDVEQDVADASEPRLEGHDGTGRSLYEDPRSLRGTEGPTPQSGPGVALPPSRGQRELRQPPGRAGQPDGGDEVVAHPESDGRSGSGLPVQPGRPRQAGDVPRWGLPLFPPGPQDLDLWARVLAEAPTLEPALCRVANELPQRVDQLRACGNGVVPLVAAVAFLALTARVVE